MEAKKKPTIVLYDGTEQSLKDISKKIRNITCGTNLKSSFVLNQDSTILFYHQYLHSYPEWCENFARQYIVRVGQYIVQKEQARPYIYNTIEAVNEFVG